MPLTPHVEQHFTSGKPVRDIVIGMSDSLTAPLPGTRADYVSEGRAALNFSEWQRSPKEAAEAADEVLDGEMPLRTYRLMHAHARLSAVDRERLARGLERTFGRSIAERGTR